MTGKGYVSPIQQIIDKAVQNIVKQDEENLMVYVKRDIGYEVDKEELVKALQYDRKQYEKGYEDGLKANRWISVDERMPDSEDDVLLYDEVDMFVGWYQKDEDEWRSTSTDYDVNTPITAWMPLPEPYKKGE